MKTPKFTKGRIKVVHTATHTNEQVFSAYFETTPTHEEEGANADLFEAAPDMYKALELIVSLTSDETILYHANIALRKAK